MQDAALLFKLEQIEYLADWAIQQYGGTDSVSP